MVILMELCKGSLLDEFNNGPLSKEKVLAYLQGLAAGFMYLHQEKHIVHRDVKPDNMLFGQDGLIRLGDLGLATAAGETGEECKDMLSTCSLATLKEQRGHKLYRSPESLQRGVAVGYGDDMWAVLMLAEMVTGRTMVQRMQGEHMRPVCTDTKFMQGVVLDVASKVGEDSLLFQVFACLIFLDPKDRLTSHDLHEWLRLGAKPEVVTLNEGIIKNVVELLCKDRGAAASVTPLVAPSGEDSSVDTLLAALTQARLAELAGAMAAEGYEELEDIVGMEFTDSELKGMSMKRGHIKCFRKFILGAYD
jgi:serine/threonine protein kinase